MATKSVGDLVEEALDAFDDPNTSTSSHVRRAIRIAIKRQDYAALMRLLPETWDLTAGRPDQPGYASARRDLVALVGKRRADEFAAAGVIAYMQRRGNKPGADAVAHAQSIGQLEALLTEYNEVNDGLKRTPDNLAPADALRVASEYDANMARLLPLRRELADIVERVKQAVHDFRAPDIAP